jgi:hypothetical protein
MEHNKPDRGEGDKCESVKQSADVHAFTDEVGDAQQLLICQLRLVHEARQT